MEGLAPGWEAAAGRRREAVDRDREWARERQAHIEALRQSHNLVRHGFAKVD